MKVSDRAITIARSFVGKTETANNDAPWLETLMRAGGNPAHWAKGEPYCIAALLAIFTMAAEAEGKVFPIPASASSQKFYEDAANLSRVSQAPEIGDIVIFRLGETWEGHAGLVTNLVKDAAGKVVGINTIEFNTSANSGTAEEMRNGQGCFAKERLFAHFPPTHLKRLWIRGYVKTSAL